MSNTETIQEFLAACNAKDIDGIVGLFADDAVYHNMQSPPINGVDAIRTAISSYATPADAIDWRFDLADDKITAWRDYFDLNQFRSQMPGD